MSDALGPLRATKYQNVSLFNFCSLSYIAAYINIQQFLTVLLEITQQVSLCSHEIKTLRQSQIYSATNSNLFLKVSATL